MIKDVFNGNEKAVSVIQKLLRLLKVPVTDSTISETLQNHPDYPSMLSLHDALHSWKIDTRIVRASIEDLDFYPLPFIADCNTKKGESYLLVTGVTENKITYYTDKQKPFVISRDEFLKIWSSITLFVEANEASGEKNYFESRKKERLSQNKLRLNIGIGLVMFILPIIAFSFGAASAGVTWGYSVLLSLKLAGLFFTSLLLWYEIDKVNPALQKLCTGGGKAMNCNAILNSKSSKLFSVISWSEIGFFYFSGSFLSMLIASLLPAENAFYIVSLLVLLNLCALPYTFFSIFYQWRVAKQWCLLCLSVQAVLALEFVTALSSGILSSSFVSITFKPFAAIPLLLVFATIGFWYLLKPLFIKVQNAKRSRRQFMRMKYNEEIFSTLLNKSKKIAYSTEGMGILLGNPAATNTIIKVCSPYCGPCANAHPEIEKLLENNNNLKVQIIFTASNDEDDFKAPPVRYLLAIAEKNNAEVTKKALDDWYQEGMLNFDAFAGKYPMNGELLRQASKLEAMDAWCDKVDIRYTPTFFINGNQLPAMYELKDLNYFLQ
ncbi:Peptidase C39 family protein [Filimonas lacunae]|uniref:Peptidase C39 family protein n=1 Tax=Filimonas lacunae TaxID=477680 RepID=A0A173MA34_9BACT|nr:vitamin K epoxide reductase family protein [Filimonas lacunae]BAV04396.1 hypothetical protein FLA_0384 [Filimonas lacunae]SIT31282.1 Peptidase C39 family protein [Filimonas lacunae]